MHFHMLFRIQYDNKANKFENANRKTEVTFQMTNIYVCEASYDKAYGVIFPYILMQVSPSSTFVSGP